MSGLFDWLAARFGIKEPHRRFLQRPLPENISYFYCLGGIAFTLFVLLVVTGLLLSVYYVPSEAEAYKSVIRINDDVFLGGILRSMHKWSANLVIFCIILHTIRVVAARSYRPPRELNWIAGVITFVLALASGFTGYLLPWDQKAYWATVVGTSMAETVPFIGRYLLYLVRGGIDVDGTTLIRFYSLHVLWLPFLMLLLLWAHFHMIRKQGISGGL